MPGKERVVTIGSRAYLYFPRPDGNKDVLLNSTSHAYQQREEAVVSDGVASMESGLYCAYHLLSVDEQGLKYRMDPCKSTPGAVECRHNLRDYEKDFHYLLRQVKIVSCYLVKKKGIELTKDEFEKTFEALSLTLYPERTFDYAKIFYERRAAVKFIKKHDRPWSSSGTLREEIKRESARSPAFKTFFKTFRDAIKEEQNASEVEEEEEVEEPEEADEAEAAEAEADEGPQQDLATILGHQITDEMKEDIKQMVFYANRLVQKAGRNKVAMVTLQTEPSEGHPEVEKFTMDVSEM